MTNRTRCLLPVLVIFAMTFTVAQTTTESHSHRTNAQIVDWILQVQQERVLAVAEAMPAEKYDFAPTRGEFRGVRSFAEQLKHIAADNYLLGAEILGEKAPGDVAKNENGSTSVQGKEAIAAYVKESFAYMRRAAATIDNVNQVMPTPAVAMWPEGTATRLGLAVEDCIHTWDHYGQLVEYLRMNGIVPPESRKPARSSKR